MPNRHDIVNVKRKNTCGSISCFVSPDTDHALSDVRILLIAKLTFCHQRLYESAGSVQMHYINMEQELSHHSLFNKWAEFMRLCGFSEKLDWSTETTSERAYLKMRHRNSKMRLILFATTFMKRAKVIYHAK